MFKFARAVYITLAALLAAFCLPPSDAHDLPYALVEMGPAGPHGRTVVINTHVPALLFGRPVAHLNDADMAAFLALSDERLDTLKERAGESFREDIYLVADGTRIYAEDIAFPDNDTLRADARARPSDPEPSAPIRLVLPAPGASTLEIALPLSLGRSLILIAGEGGEDQPLFLEPGERSGPIDLDRPGGAWRTAQVFLEQGVLHIVPLGLDHILFVIALAVVSVRLRWLILQISAFTLAHTATLALSALDIVPAPAGLVEPLIALSIAAMALDNIRRPEPAPWRPYAVVGFGFLHGFGFAGALRELGLPEGQEIVALAAFNVGVEIGQILVVAAVFLAVGWFMKTAGYRQFVIVPVSLAVAVVGLFWFFERIGVFPWA